MVAKSRPGTANLKPPINKRPRAEQVAISRRGGIASGKAKRAKKLMREQLEYLLNIQTTNPKIRKRLENAGIAEEEWNNQMAINLAIFKRALEGDVRAYLAIRDTMGQNPDKLTQAGDSDKRKVVIVDDLPNND